MSGCRRRRSPPRLRTHCRRRAPVAGGRQLPPSARSYPAVVAEADPVMSRCRPQQGVQQIGPVLHLIGRAIAVSKRVPNGISAVRAGLAIVDRQGPRRRADGNHCVIGADRLERAGRLGPIWTSAPAVSAAAACSRTATSKPLRAKAIAAIPAITCPPPRCSSDTRPRTATLAHCLATSKRAHYRGVPGQRAMHSSPGNHLMGFFANSLNRIQPAQTIAISAKARALKAEGRDVIGLAPASPISTRRPTSRKRRSPAIRRGETKYTDVDGIPSSKGDRREVQARQRARLQALRDHRRYRRQAGAVQRPDGHRRSRRRGGDPGALLGELSRHRAVCRGTPVHRRPVSRDGYKLHARRLSTRLSPPGPNGSCSTRRQTLRVPPTRLRSSSS